MTTGNEAARRTLPLGWDSDEAQDTAGRFLARLRPADGWIALLLLVANLCVVVMSVERADWAPTPSLVGLLLLAMLTAFVFHKLPVVVVACASAWTGPGRSYRHLANLRVLLRR